MFLDMCRTIYIYIYIYKFVVLKNVNRNCSSLCLDHEINRFITNNHLEDSMILLYSSFHLQTSK